MTTENPNNFFDDLERRLVAATTDRPRRLRRARRRSIATLCTMLVAVLAVGGGIAAALSNTAGDEHSSAPAGTPHTPPAVQTVPLAPSLGVPKRGSFEIAVLNGTTVPGLARGVANRLQSAGFKIGTVTNAATQDAGSTLVYYARPSGFRAAAETIDAVRGLSRHQPRPAPPGARTLAGDGATVIVVVGSDQNRTP